MTTAVAIGSKIALAMAIAVATAVATSIAIAITLAMTMATAIAITITQAMAIVMTTAIARARPIIIDTRIVTIIYHKSQKSFDKQPSFTVKNPRLQLVKIDHVILVCRTSSNFPAFEIILTFLIRFSVGDSVLT